MAKLGFTSASGVIALLEDNEIDVQKHALGQLNQLVDHFWPEIAEREVVERIEKLSEDEGFPDRQAASLLASKVYFHLGVKADALQFALGAGALFTELLSQETEYVTTLIAECVDEYANRRREQVVDKEKAPKIDTRLEAIVEAMFLKCFEEKEFKQAIGMAIESMRLDIIRKAISLSGEQERELLQYCYQACLDLVVNRELRQTIFSLLVELYAQASVPDFMNVCRCLVFLDKATDIGQLFVTLLDKNEDEKTLLVFQMAFELVDNATQQFRTKVIEAVPHPASGSESQRDANLAKLHKILSGEVTVKLNLEFLLRSNKTDLGILRKIKTLFEPRISILHTATIVANSIMHCGTTKDTFLREGLEWLSKAVAWAKFTTTAGLGVIHKGHIQDAFTVLGPYLPKPGVEASPYTEGGSLCALGLIHANHGTDKIISYLMSQLTALEHSYLQNLQNNNPAPGSLDADKKKEIVQHGAVLGLGLAAMGTQNKEVFETLKQLCFTSKDAVAGEACGISMGLVMLGSATKEATDLLNFAHQTQHEKVIRSIGLGLGFTMLGLREVADTMIESLTGDKDPVLRYTGQYAVGLAYCGTANNNAIRKLLHFAVSDVSDDVRRAAVLSLGFVLFRQPEQVPRLVSLLSESYNPHVRYGAALALGIACAGTAMKEAITLLEPLAHDSVPFVRQGAFIALAMVLIQASESAEPKVKTIRQLFIDTVGDKHQSIMAKFGAILALGIIDAGGRNQTISLSSRSGHLNLSAIVGLTVFTQYWYWYPFLNFISLAFTPTAIIGVNKNLEMPNYKIKSNAKPSMFAYPPEMKPPKEKVVKALPTATLSVTKTQQRRAEKKKAEKDGDKMVVEGEPKKEEDNMDVEKEEKKEKEKAEPTFELLSNPARVTKSQLPLISFDVDQRYAPVVEGVHGVILLNDQTPSEKEDLIEAVPAGGIEDEPEAEPPKPFKFLGARK